MANTYSYFQPEVFTNKALDILLMNLGLARRVHRGYNITPTSRGKAIDVPIPSSVTASSAPSAVQSLTASGVQITLDHWRDAVWAMPDNYANQTQEQWLALHIAPAASALARELDTYLQAIAAGSARAYGTAGSPICSGSLADLTLIRKAMNDAYIPDDGKRHLMVDTASEASLLQNSTIIANAGAPSNTQNALLAGNMATLFGLEIFSSQNVQTHAYVSGTFSGTSAITISGTAGATTCTLMATTCTGVLTAGDVINISSLGKYVIASTTATASGATHTITLTRPLASTITADVVTFITSHSAMLAFHENFACLAFGTLPTPDYPNVRSFVATSQESGIALRGMRYYDPANKQECCSLDLLYGIKVLDADLGVKVLG